jgi:hypothetical protein
VGGHGPTAAPGTHILHVTGTLDGLDQPIVETFTLIVTQGRGRP